MGGGGGGLVSNGGDGQSIVYELDNNGNTPNILNTWDARFFIHSWDHTQSCLLLAGPYAYMDPVAVSSLSDQTWNNVSVAISSSYFNPFKKKTITLNNSNLITNDTNNHSIFIWCDTIVFNGTCTIDCSGNAANPGQIVLGAGVGGTGGGGSDGGGGGGASDGTQSEGGGPGGGAGFNGSTGSANAGQTAGSGGAGGLGTNFFTIQDNNGQIAGGASPGVATASCWGASGYGGGSGIGFGISAGGGGGGGGGCCLIIAREWIFNPGCIPNLVAKGGDGGAGDSSNGGGGNGGGGGCLMTWTQKITGGIIVPNLTAGQGGLNGPHNNPGNNGSVGTISANEVDTDGFTTLNTYNDFTHTWNHG